MAEIRREVCRNPKVSFAFLLVAASLPGMAKEKSTDQLAKEFRQKVDTYVRLRHEVEKRLPPVRETKDPAELKARSQALSKGIQAARSGAQPGDVFGSSQAYLLDIIRSEMLGPGGTTSKETVREDNPQSEGKRVVLKVNAKYPSDAPLSTIPPALLLKLPELPEDIEYRFVGQNLILFDARCHLIVDFIRDAIPR